jgi:hypothetical protein
VPPVFAAAAAAAADTLAAGAAAHVVGVVIIVVVAVMVVDGWIDRTIPRIGRTIIGRLRGRPDLSGWTVLGRSDVSAVTGPPGRTESRKRRTEIGRFAEKIGRLSDDSNMGLLEPVGDVASTSRPN